MRIGAPKHTYMLILRRTAGIRTGAARLPEQLKQKAPAETEAQVVVDEENPPPEAGAGRR
jgi:hypothetical protein